MIFRLILALCVLAPSIPALAAQPLVFRDTAKNIREESIIAFLTNQGLLLSELPYKIAETDLNYDGVNEWIVEQSTMSGCESAKTCSFVIVGLKTNAPALLGNFKAGKITISDERRYGIRILEVYDKAANDFEFTRYSWNPSKQVFSQ